MTDPRPKYADALERDPTNIIAIMYRTEELVSAGKDREAVEYFDRLKAANASGVGYSAYPEVALAFARTGQPDKSIEVLTELETRITVISWREHRRGHTFRCIKYHATQGWRGCRRCSMANRGAVSSRRRNGSRCVRRWRMWWRR